MQVGDGKFLDTANWRVNYRGHVTLSKHNAPCYRFKLRSSTPTIVSVRNCMCFCPVWVHWPSLTNFRQDPRILRRLYFVVLFYRLYVYLSAKYSDIVFFVYQQKKEIGSCERASPKSRQQLCSNFCRSKGKEGQRNQGKWRKEFT